MIKFVILVVLVTLGVAKSNVDYFDPVIDMLLNGVSTEVTQTAEDNINEKESVFTGVIWKCGNCTDLGEAKMVHSEVNEGDANIGMDKIDVQISLTLEHMRCVTVAAENAGVVLNVLGSCEGSSVTLSVLPSNNFTIMVYN